MANREKMKKALHEYIEALDDQGMYDFVDDQEIDGPDVFSCKVCEGENNDGECVDAPEICLERFKKWINK